MSAIERRYKIMKILCRRRNETVNNLATELKVSPRTIERDIEFLSTTEPIYTQPGRYSGGVYIVEGYSMERMYMSDEEIGVLEKIFTAVDGQASFLTYEELCILKSVISQYSKPQNKNERIKK